jgi:uncharacterized membrane protein YqaE (UPF0057 family)
MNKNDDRGLVLLVFLAILLPPVAVFIKDGLGIHLLLNVMLCCLFWIPAVIHAMIVVLATSPPQ